MKQFNKDTEPDEGASWETLFSENETNPRPLGTVIGGSHSTGIEVKLESSIPVEELQIGNYVTIQGKNQRFFGWIGDIALEAINPQLKTTPIDVGNPFIAQIILDTAVYSTIHVKPKLMLPPDPVHTPAKLGSTEVVKAKTIPGHFSEVFMASESDMAEVFGKEDKEHFWIGNPLDMELKICLNLNNFIVRNNGIFGKTGTGKSFLTKLILCGILQKTEAATLVFDMHNEHGWQGRNAEQGRQVKGLKQLFGSRVAVFTLDPKRSQARGLNPEGEIRIPYEEITPEDIEINSGYLNLTEIGIQTIHSLPSRLGTQWLTEFMDATPDLISTWSEQWGEHVQSLNALKRRLQTIKRLPFLVTEKIESPLKRILEYLQRGIHVIIEFGSFGRSELAYMLVANLLTRRIFEEYFQLAEEADATGGEGPRRLIIVVEEAHRFLDPSLSSQHIFGTIAREMRKANVHLLIIDQRPSGIDTEVLSQLGTKITYPLNNDQDISAVMAGETDSRELRAVLAGLESTQQALIFGDAVPIPVVVKVREYGSAASYKALEQTETNQDDSRPTKTPNLFG